jgi:ribonuclease-3
MTTAPPLDSLQAALAYRFTNPVLLQEALTHKSFINERKTTAGSHNERLEFVGDAVLSLVVSEQLAALLPQSSEGALSKHKARLVSESMLAHVARRLKVGDCLRLGRGEELSRGREKDSLLADALEALIAAVYLDGGLESSRRVVIGLLERELRQVVTQQHRPGEDDYKTQVQEWCQRRFDSLPSTTKSSKWKLPSTGKSSAGEPGAARRKPSRLQPSKHCMKLDGRRGWYDKGHIES